MYCIPPSFLLCTFSSPSSSFFLPFSHSPPFVLLSSPLFLYFFLSSPFLFFSLPSSLLCSLCRSGRFLLQCSVSLTCRPCWHDGAVCGHSLPEGLSRCQPWQWTLQTKTVSWREEKCVRPCMCAQCVHVCLHCRVRKTLTHSPCRTQDLDT